MAEGPLFAVRGGSAHPQGRTAQNPPPSPTHAHGCEPHTGVSDDPVAERTWDVGREELGVRAESVQPKEHLRLGLGRRTPPPPTFQLLRGTVKPACPAFCLEDQVG